MLFGMRDPPRQGRRRTRRRTRPPSWMILAGLVLGELLLAGSLLSACASAPPGSKPPVPARPLDLGMPAEPPEPALLAGLPIAWDQEARRSTYRLETGP